MINVVHVINSLGLGGGERFLFDLVSHLDRSRFRSQVVCLYKAGELAEPLRATGVPVSVLGISHRVKPGSWLQVWRLLRGLSADIVHTHLPEACWHGLPAAWLAGIPVRIAHLQNSHWAWPMKLRFLDRAISIFATKAIACSEAVRRFYEERIHYAASKLEVFYNSVDLRRFERLPDRYAARHSIGLPQDALILVCVASLTEQKGHAYLLEAMIEVHGEFPEVLLLLVGDGSLRSELERDVERKKLGPAVRFLGRRTDVPLILAASDIFVLPSLWEGLGIVLAEAGAAGLPAVATHVDGVPEVINDGVTGFLVPAKISQALAEAILRLLRDSELRQKVGIQARQHVMERFNITNIARDMELLYVALLTSAKRAT